jgi:hypothetical protein
VVLNRRSGFVIFGRVCSLAGPAFRGHTPAYLERDVVV